MLLIFSRYWWCAIYVPGAAGLWVHSGELWRRGSWYCQRFTKDVYKGEGREAEADEHNQLDKEEWAGCLGYPASVAWGTEVSERNRKKDRVTGAEGLWARGWWEMNRDRQAWVGPRKMIWAQWKEFILYPKSKGVSLWKVQSRRVI